MDKIKIQIPAEFEELRNESWRNIALWGGRSSGKSQNTATTLLLRGREKKLRILCTRQIQNTIKDSVHKLLKDQIEKFEFNDYAVTDDAITNRLTGTEFIFKGLLRNIQEIKSLEGVDICWVEEAQTTTNETLDILTPTIRKEGSQIIFTFNRYTELDPVYLRYVQKKPPKTYEKKINYDILQKLGLLPQVVIDEIEYDKLNNPELYAYKWLGEPLSQNEFSIIPRAEILQSMQRVIDDIGQVEVGVDVARMGDDRTVLWKRKGLKTIDYRIYGQQRVTNVVALVEEFVSQDKQILIKVDDTGVGGGVTDMLLQRAYNVQAVNFGGEPADKDKYPNRISEMWFTLKEMINQVQLPQDQDLLMELSTRQWKQDIRGRRCVESKQDYKKRGYRSPDLADSCILAYSQPSAGGWINYLKGQNDLSAMQPNN